MSRNFGLPWTIAQHVEKPAGHRATQARVGHLPWGWKEILAEHKKAQIHGWLCRKCEDNEDHWEAIRREEEANKKELEEEMAASKLRFEADKAVAAQREAERHEAAALRTAERWKSLLR